MIETKEPKTMTKADKKIVDNLAKHYARMNELIATGMDRLAASKQAFGEITGAKSALVIIDSQIKEWEARRDIAKTSYEHAVKEIYSLQTRRLEYESDWHVGERIEIPGYLNSTNTKIYEITAVKPYSVFGSRVLASGALGKPKRIQNWDLDAVLQRRRIAALGTCAESGNIKL